MMNDKYKRQCDLLVPILSFETWINSYLPMPFPLVLRWVNIKPTGGLLRNLMTNFRNLRLNYCLLE